MVDPEKALGEFMATKNTEALGEVAPGGGGEDNDNYLAENKILNVSFGDQTAPDNDKIANVFRKVLTFIFGVVMLIGTVFTVMYFLTKVGPSILSFVRNLLFGFARM
ncbi:MAG: hypothetical protein LBI29_03710 [Rickettsiales bacterium]|jgi:hypothetical protein|nr:hypothetical protein [Rickettsiales bacterium]